MTDRWAEKMNLCNVNITKPEHVHLFFKVNQYVMLIVIVTL